MPWLDTMGANKRLARLEAELRELAQNASIALDHAAFAAEWDDDRSYEFFQKLYKLLIKHREG